MLFINKPPTSEQCEQIRSFESGKHTPVIMLTVEQKKENIIEAIKSGADDYIIKPLKPDVLKNKINKVAEKYGIEVPESLKSGKPFEVELSEDTPEEPEDKPEQ